MERRALDLLACCQAELTCRGKAKGEQGHTACRACTAQGSGEGSSHCCLPPSPVPQKSCLHAPARGRLLLKGRSLPRCWELTILHVKTCFCCVWCTTTQIAAELKPLGKTREPLIRGCSSHCQAGNGEGMLFALPTQRGGKEKSIYSSKVGSFS